MKKILRSIGGLLIVIGLVSILAELLGYPLLIYYGDPISGALGMVGIFLGFIFLTVADLIGTLNSRNPLEIYIKFIDTYNENIGIGVGWFTTVMVVVVFVNVVLRYVYGQSFLQLQDMSWYVFGVVFMIGAAYTLKYDRHVRVDIFYINYSPKLKAWVNLLGTLFFLVPFCLLGMYVSWDFVARSFAVQETSPDAGGLAARYLAKAIIPAGFGLILLQGIALIFKNILQLQGKRPMDEEGAS